MGMDYLWTYCLACGLLGISVLAIISLCELISNACSVDPKQIDSVLRNSLIDQCTIGKLFYRETKQEENPFIKDDNTLAIKIVDIKENYQSKRWIKYCWYDTLRNEEFELGGMVEIHDFISFLIREEHILTEKNIHLPNAIC